MKPNTKTMATPGCGQADPWVSACRPLRPSSFQGDDSEANSGKVQISEYLGLQASSDEFAVIDRVLLDRPRWTAIRSEVQREFNARLKAHNLKTSAWKVGENPVDRLLGKELCVSRLGCGRHGDREDPCCGSQLAGLRPEERWWLFGMTAMATGTVKDGGRAGGSHFVMPWAMSLKANCCSPVAQTKIGEGQRRARSSTFLRTRLNVDGGADAIRPKGCPALIEAVFPAQKVSFEAQTERKAVAAQTLTGLGSYWKGRKPLILVRAIVLGSLLPQTGRR